MYLPVIRYLLSNEMIRALFWTLLHSLWQGVLFAIVTGLTLTFTRRSSSALRYNMLCGIFLLFITGIVLTFYCELNLTTENIISKASSNIGYGYSANAGMNDKQDIIERMIAFIELNEDIIVLSWFLIIAFKCLRLLSGLRTIYILKHKHVFDAGEYWNNRLKELAKKIHVETSARLLRSAIAKIPMVAGHFKPVILFPAAMLSTLPEKEIEAILLHELAHIRRKDYLVNMLQSFAEIIFFFNPAVLWISSLIKDERENCCDDITIGEVKNKKQFIHALLSFEEYHIDSKYAASFPGRKKHLVNRVRRIITNNNKTLNNMEKIFLATGVLVTCLILVSFSEKRQLAGSQKQNIIQISKVDEPLYRTDTVPKTENNNTVHNTSSNESRIISTSMDGKHYKIVEINGKVSELYVDNVRIPDDKIGQYKTTIDKIHQHLKADQKKQADEMKLQQEQLTAQAETMKQKELMEKEQMEKQADQMKMQQKQMMEQSELMKQKEELMKENFEKQADQMKMQEKELMMKADTMNEKQELLMKENFEKQAEQMKVQQKQMAEQSEMMKQKEQLMKEQTEKQADQMKMKEEEMKKLMSKHQEELEKQKEQQKQLKQQLPDTVNQSKPILPTDAIKPITRDEVAYRVNREVAYRVNQEILRNHVIRYPRNFSFTRTNKQLTINRQPEQLF